MGATSGTRRGNGAGWGGSAKGEGHKYTIGDPLATELGGAPGTGKRKIADMLSERGAREKVVDRWLAILDDPAHPHHAAMIEKAATRMDGAPLQSIAGEDGGPIRQTLEVVIVEAPAPGDQAATPGASTAGD